MWMLSNWNAAAAVALLLFLFFAGVGMFFTAHRSFMHSLFAAALFSQTVWFFCRPLALPFGAAYLSHLVLDVANRRGIQLFFPFRKRVCLRLCSAGGRTNRVLFSLSLILAALLGGGLLLRMLHL